MLERAEADGTWHIEYDAREGFETEEAHVDFLSSSVHLHLHCLADDCADMLLLQQHSGAFPA